MPEKIHPLSPPSPVLMTRQHLPRTGSSSTTTGGVGGCNVGSGAGGFGIAGHHNINRLPHGQIVANIENNPLHYERDWTLDDSSQSSFKPCPQGSGSMTPFHDSVHNMYENPAPPVRSSSHSTNGSGSDLNQMPNIATASAMSSAATIAKTNDLNLFKVNTHMMNFPNSAVFLENSDILNDADYPKLYHRHSTIFMSPEINDNLDKFLVKDTRRYSDTKLMHQQRIGTSSSAGRPVECVVPIFNVTNVLGVAIQSTTASNADEPAANVTDIIFEQSGSANSTFDPLELNIAEMLELDVHQQHLAHKKARLSLNNVTSDIDATAVVATGAPGNRNLFKSLPNLSASSENLLQPK